MSCSIGRSVSSVLRLHSAVSRLPFLGLAGSLLAGVLAGCAGATATPTATAAIPATASPTPATVRTAIPTIEATVSPTLSPGETLKQEFAAYLGTDPSIPETTLPDSGRFYLYLLPGQLPALANVLAFNGVVNHDYSQPDVEPEFQGYVVDERVVTGADGGEYLIVYMGQESVRSRDGTSQRYIVPVNLGGIGSADIDYLITGKGIEASSNRPATKIDKVPVSEVRTQIGKFKGQFVIFGLCVVNVSERAAPSYFDAIKVFRSPEYLVAQSAVAKAVLEFSVQTRVKPYSQVVQSKLVESLVNQSVNDGFDPSAVPTALVIMFQ